jgi:RimJ/RimL family protein N-acetyltransferase
MNPNSLTPRGYLTSDRLPFTVRVARPDDVQAVLNIQRTAIAESEDYFVRTPEELDSSRQEAAATLAGLLSRDNCLWLVAEREGEVIGSLDFHGGEFARIRHVGSFGVTVRADFRNHGVGKGLVEMLLLWATSHPYIEKLTTNLFTNNTRAVALFNRFGFQSEGRRHREFLVAPGRYLDSILLAKWIK